MPNAFCSPSFLKSFLTLAVHLFMKKFTCCAVKDKLFLFLNFLFFLSFIPLFSTLEDNRSHYVLVSVSPHKFFVDRIAGSTVKVGLLVPAGASAHTYEPTPKQMLTASSADLWFRTGESFEEKALQALQSHRPTLKAIDLRRGLNLISNDGYSSCHCCHANAYDLHFWLSARLAKIQASTIAQALIAMYPENSDLYTANLTKFHEELDRLDHEIEEILVPLKNRYIFVSHPAYAYFCRDYHLSQLSIECEGKDPTPQQLTKTLNKARELEIKSIYIQLQYNNKGAKLIAKEIGARVITLDPYSENYIFSMLEIAHAFAKN